MRQRRLLLKELQVNPSYQIITAEPVATVSLLRRWLGDQAIQEIIYRSPSTPSSPELARISRIFPEAAFREEQLRYEPCHPGCFPAGTMVRTLSGLQCVETIHPGDFITTIDADGDATSSQVQSIFVTDNRLWQADTDAGPLITTQTQPLYVGAGKVLQVGDLQPGDTIFRWQDGTRQPVKVLAVSSTGRVEKVYNLILGNSEVFIAGGFLARSKPPAE